MPIRSPKGRSAAYRPLWQWPLRSPARFFGCVLVFVLLALGLNAATGLIGGRDHGVFGSSGQQAAQQPGQPAGAQQTRAPAAAAPTVPAQLPPVPELSPANLPPSQAPAAALSTATKWVQAWANHPPGMTTQSWVNGLRPYTTDEYLGVLDSVDPANVPATKVRGPARAVLVSPHSVRVEVPTDALTVLVLVVDASTGDEADGGPGPAGNGSATTAKEWKVAGYDRADPAQNPAAGR